MGQLFVIAGPSGSGKSYLVENVLKVLPEARRVVTATSRKPQNGEVEGKDYIFVSSKQFEQLIESGKLAEWALVYGNYYGTLKSSLKDALSQELPALIILDVTGVRTIKRIVPRAITIFVSCDPVIAARRISVRNLSQNDYKWRVGEHRREVEASQSFDFIVFNEEGQPEKAVAKICSIVRNGRVP